MMKRTKKLVVTATTSLALLAALGSGTLLATHAANDVSSVGQTAAPTTATTAGAKLTAASASGTRQNYTVDYRGAGQSATFQKRTLGSAGTAADEVNYVGRGTQGPTVSLNHGTKAVVQGVMGHTYVHWNTGKWSVTAVTNNADQTGTPTQFAKQVNQQLTQQDLPSNATTGAVTVYSSTNDDAGSAQTNTVKWQSGKQLYTVSGQTAASTVKLAQNSDR